MNLLNNKNFVNWFGKSELLTCDPLGTPLKFYHKSRSKEVFDEFKLAGENVVKNPYNNDYGFFFVQEKDSHWINYIGDGIEIFCYLRMVNPGLIWDDGAGKIMDCRGKVYDALYITKDLVDSVISDGHDGIIIGTDKHYSQYVVFNPNQIKSIENNGEFSIETNNIYK